MWGKISRISNRTAAAVRASKITVTSHVRPATQRTFSTFLATNARLAMKKTNNRGLLGRRRVHFEAVPAPSTQRITSAKAQTDGQTVRISFDDGSVGRYHALWLRDHCPCDLCRHSGTLQRLISTADIPLNITAADVSLTAEGNLQIRWEDGPHAPHISTYTPEFLVAHAYWCNGSAGETLPAVSPLYVDPVLRTQHRVLWKAQNFGNVRMLDEDRGFPSITSSEFKANDEGLYKALCLLRDYGFLRIEGVEATEAATEAHCRRISFLRETLYGTMWRTEVKTTGVNDTAFCLIPLPSHTDCNYLNDTPGIQCFHCIQADKEGGDSLLIDGFALAEAMKHAYPETFEFLTTTPLPYHHTDPDHHYVQWKTVFTLDSAGKVMSFNFNNDDRAVLGGHIFGLRRGNTATPHQVDPAMIPQIYRHMGVLMSMLRNPEYQLWMALRPGTLLVFDNTRTLHGRSAITPGSGRVLSGCYIGAEDWHSRLRAVAAKLGRYRSALTLR